MSGSSGASPVVTTLTVDDTNLRTALANAATLINGYTRANEAAARALAQHGTGSDTAAGGVRNLGSYVGQAGLQLQDFAVQVQAGTSAITALSQQGSQFLGAFGTGGAMAGAVLTVGILVSQFLRTEDATEAAKRAADSYATAVERLRDLMESAAEKAERLRQNSIAAGVAAARALGETATRRGEDLGEQILRADGDLQRMEAQRAQMRGANSAGLAARRLDANIEAARRRVESLRGDANIAGAEVRESQRMLRLLQEQRESEGGAGKGKPTESRSPSGRAARPAEELGPGMREFALSVQKAAEEFRSLEQALDPALAAFDRADERVRVLADAFDAGRIGAGRFNELLDATDAALRRDIASAGKAADDLTNLGREFSTVFTSAFDGLISRGGTLTDVLERLSTGLARVIERQFLIKPLEGALSKAFEGITWSGIAGAIGLRAKGGPVTAGSPYIVGERGPELFVPDISGGIVPNHALGGGGGVSIMVDARGAEQGVEARIDAVLARRLPGILAASRADMIARVNRGGADAQAFGRRGR